MTILEEDPKLANIDSFFDDDHFVCCKVEDGFTGFTTGFCGTQVFLDGSDQEWVDEVACQRCNAISENEDDNWCPLGHNCMEED